MPGFQFTDDDDPTTPAQPAQPAGPPPAGGPPRPAPPAAKPGPPAGGGTAAPKQPATKPLQANPPRPRPQNPQSQAGTPAAPGRPPGGPPAGAAAGPTAPGIGPGGVPKPAAGTAKAPHGPARSAPRYGEGGNVLPSDAPAAQHAPGASYEGLSSVVPGATEVPDAGIPTDKAGQALYEIGQSVKSVLDMFEDPASWVLRISFAVGAMCLAYILAGVFLGHPAQAHGPNSADLARNLRYASQGLSYALLFGFIASMLVGYEDTRVGILAAATGVLLHLGLPLGLKAVVGNSAATAGMAAMFRGGGWRLLIVGLIKVGFDTLAWLVTLPEKVKSRADVGFARPAELKQQAVAREANMFSPCWKLPFCREVIRKQCPAFLAKKTCWKFGRGCYCDEEMIGRIIRGEDLAVIKAPTRLSRTGKPPCGRCYIFLEHQTHKFRMISPLALPMAALATFIVWPIYSRAFGLFDKATQSVWKSLSFNPTTLTPDALKLEHGEIDPAAYSANPEQIAHYAMIMLGVLMGFFLLIYVSKCIEWAIYKAKW